MTAIANTYDRQTAQFLAVVAQNMPEMSGDVMQGWIQNPKAVKKLLFGFAPPETIATSKALTSNGFRISDWAGDILKKTTLASAETEIELVLVTVSGLGFTKATRRDVIYDRARELGLDLVPAEVGPQLRLQYTDQPLNEWMVMAMEPIAYSDGGLGVFRVVHNHDGRWLSADYGIPGRMWSPDYRWVFARRKQN
jgi:hypothetical protein